MKFFDERLCGSIGCVGVRSCAGHAGASAVRRSQALHRARVATAAYLPVATGSGVDPGLSGGTWAQRTRTAVDLTARPTRRRVLDLGRGVGALSLGFAFSMAEYRSAARRYPPQLRCCTQPVRGAVFHKMSGSLAGDVRGRSATRKAVRPHHASLMAAAHCRCQLDDRPALGGESAPTGLRLVWRRGV